ncbi:putative dehydrogenase [Arenibacter algicola]|jgi:predicted dehydrogenase|uniref:Dehydrogenase n=1 Tax=Arenibacter algicola TaxID=616991 RepID=A0A221UUX3_9FLAO|nr:MULTISPECIES: Gfo/Idh/MocA family oxidoreductase [Arenibacter]ASO04998.1 scyllo-inositol 2-dehydrogenase (NAD(+)) [Arenibacter algicola]MBD3660777.1 Gfo/Idh/MocA family oxidoreductase [Arenibacter algicola]GBF18388.1 putative oxidoreductase YhhX [Arenibacter sp. NBRC 103722]HCO84258.1 gfo/Idh/MocA family oxidoreductase [Arenibacter sp.]|tara:strand:+ start:10854 stop:12320 length:1467 start_codon:yes stop_codon:yes gene_type:complete
MKKKKSNKSVDSRRSFIKKGALASSIFFVPRHVLGGVGYTAPSDRLNIAAIGAGGKGASDIRNASVGGREKVVALCDVDFSGSAKKSVELFPKAKLYADFREMLDKEKGIDAVTISTPDHVHGPAAKYAMERGINVYVQKPMTHNIREARMLTEMARSNKIVTQMGNQGGSNPLLGMVQKWVDSGELGKISKVQVWTNRPVWPQGGAFPKPDPSAKPKDLDWDLWLGPSEFRPYTPNLHPFGWRGWWEYGTGALGDVGCHLIDIPFRTLGLKYPTDAECSVGAVYTNMWNADYHPEGCPASSFITLHFGATEKSQSPIEMTWSDGGIRPAHPEIIPADHEIGGNGSQNGVLIIGEKGIISTNINDSSPLMPKLYMNDGSTDFGPEVEPNDEPEYGHQRLWIDACKAGFGSKEHLGLTSSFDYAGPMTETVLMGNLAIRSYLLQRENEKGKMEFFARKKLLWDGENMRITNLEEANQFVTRNYRPGFVV